ncbi:MAG: exodeoxyribonuclease III [Pseudomonadota bacterium]
MRITTWNINSVRLRINSVLDFLEKAAPDVLCLQETKCPDDQFPEKQIRKAGYEHIALCGQKSYNGVAILSRLPLQDVSSRSFCGKSDARHVSAKLPGAITLHNFYVPAGGDEPDPDANEKFAHKLDFLAEMAEWLTPAGASRQRMVLVGDLNVAPRPSDVWSHKQLLNVVSHTPIEVERLDAVMASRGWLDVARELVPEPEPIYSWWSYRAKDWRASNRGRRLDHIWATPALKKAALANGPAGFRVHDDVRDWEKPSDHAPVTVDFDLAAKSG